jgi:dTDP-4-dehydrorhamnose 3,5-epimerase
MKYKIHKPYNLPDVRIIEPDIFRDIRGMIYTSYDQQLDSLLPEGLRFVHDKFAFSKRNVLRGMHGDNKTWKLISCVSGMVYQAVIDLREGSETYKNYLTLVLSPGTQILIPPGFLNGYYCYLDSVYHYKLAYAGSYVDANQQITMKWNDPSLGIKWPEINPILQKRDE